MNCDVLTMPADEAERKYAEYVSAMGRNPKNVTETDKQILKAYNVARKGGRLIDVNEAIAAGGLNLAGLPRLALGRAHVRSVFFEHSYRTRLPGRQWRFNWMRHTRHTRVTDDRVYWWIPQDAFPQDPSTKRCEALTPLIPLPLRPQSRLDRYFVMWEANWLLAPPVDPYLLKPLAGSLMEIVAEWDVTPLELAAVKASTIA